MKEWLSIESNPSSTGFDIMAASHWQLNEKKMALILHCRSGPKACALHRREKRRQIPLAFTAET